MSEQDLKMLDLLLRAFKRAKFQSLEGEEVLHLSQAFSHLLELKSKYEATLKDEEK